MRGMTTADTPDARFYTMTEAAAILNVNPTTISRQCAAGLFPHVRIGRTVRIPVAEVERLERGEPQRTSVLDVPDYATGVPSMFDAIPEADSAEDEADGAGLVHCTGPCCDPGAVHADDDAEQETGDRA